VGKLSEGRSRLTEMGGCKKKISSKRIQKEGEALGSNGRQDQPEPCRPRRSFLVAPVFRRTFPLITETDRPGEEGWARREPIWGFFDSNLRADRRPPAACKSGCHGVPALRVAGFISTSWRRRPDDGIHVTTRTTARTGLSPPGRMFVANGWLHVVLSRGGARSAPAKPTTF